ncbi:tRNA lysidine(34) synthetase TilS [Mycolicibacterium sp.]|uniref:tRNA lysidine(34) synthetase TilS n=1 Tax=Mycolicibacterium sp. TaxID=2320850 RepID=UPI0028B14664|nr:tRNA lysidine(34) synthetase TilS [Mycolicibacterium sp.]
MDRPGPVAALRSALTRHADTWLADSPSWCVALSGGPDSLALTAVAATVRPTTALIVDHALQPGSAEVAEAARRQAVEVGCVAARVLAVRVGAAGGPEAAARTARYAALDSARATAPVLLAHTLDDQAETVLLGLGRGSGPRSLAGMRAADPPWHRPLLGLRRRDTRATCAELGLTAWDDPHNTDRRFTRVRLRTEVLPLLEDVLGGGVAEALARTAAALREDTEALDAMARSELDEAAAAHGLAVGAIADLPAALRLRVVRGWLLTGGATDLTDGQIRAVDALVTGWRGQGGVAVGCDRPRTRLFAQRRGGFLVLRTEPV